MGKSRLEQLIEKNRVLAKRKSWAENELLQDCLKSVKAKIVEAEQEINEIADNMCKKFPIDEYRRIDGVVEIQRENIEFESSKKYYILWDDAELPILQCFGGDILNHLDDIFSVSFDTYIFSEDFRELVHSDDLGALWKFRREKHGIK